MVQAFLLFLAINTASVFLVAQLLEGFAVGGGTLGYVVVGLLIGILNLVVKPVLKVLALPLLFLTAGLFVILINAAILWLAVQALGVLDLSPISLTIEGLVSYVMAAVILGLVNYLLQKLFRS